MVTELLQKYVWLINTVMRAGERGLALGEIASGWEFRFGTPYSRSSFNRHREAIAEFFGIEIECDRSSARYFIRYGSDLKDTGSSSAWLINTFTVNRLLSLSRERLSGRVSVEEIPSGHKYLTPIMDAMMDNREIRIDYRKYTSDKAEQYTLRPYAVKEASRRWYVVGYCIERQGIRVYGLDRIMEMEVSERIFAMPADFDVDEIFATSYGIYLSDAPGRLITFRATSKEARFLRDLPIHASQKETASDTGHVTFSIFVTPNEDLIMEFCRHGNRIEVLEPQDVREAVASELSKSADIYRKK